MKQRVYVVVSDRESEDLSLEAYESLSMANLRLADIISEYSKEENAESSIYGNVINIGGDNHSIHECTIIPGGDNEAEASTSEASTINRNGLEETSNQAVLADEGPR